ncbi:diguanylate cyclase [Thalassotalea sp. 1_MG-2023]|uniref:sensor domain-containing diguanylate cyclase n=1 Tax=Thalassotalea sp. 1_MG-2023 TaxID=3062680 RepID=UPI0026E2555F|nr:diguanylate cyclase [Thalassotalea sp. 1_MG-2023]MDO6427238.1 diguanylate cyclase [Thalassotalea sp. 1_MG-2023]
MEVRINILKLFLVIFMVFPSLFISNSAFSTPFDEPSVLIKSSSVELTEFSMSYFVDNSESMLINDILLQRFTPIVSKLSLGTDAKFTWAKIKVHNQQQQAITLYLHHPHAYHLKFVSFYETQNKKVLEKFDIPLYQSGKKPLMYGGTAVFPFTLAANETKAIYVKNESFSHQWFQLSMYDEQASKQALVGTGKYIALLVGMMLALMIYNFFLYISARKVENFVYALYLISGTIWVSLSYGVAANFFGVFSAEVFQLNSNVLSMPSFLVLFIMLIFDTKKRYPKEHLALSLLLVLLVGDFIYSLFDISAALKPASTLAATMMLITFGVSISLWRKREPLAKYFFLGHSMFIIFNMLAVFYYKGLSDFNQINSHGVGIGILLEALMMAFVLSYRIKELERIKGKQEELKRLAETDPMTELFNRRYFQKAAQQAIHDAKEKQNTISIMVIDIDHFKTINDNYGHSMGDDIIITFAKLLMQHQRDNDIVCRYGGEEFLLLLPGCDSDNAYKVAERIRQAASEEVIVNTQQNPVTYTVSIGVHQLDLTSDTIQSAINAADKALYHAKSAGRNQVKLTQEKLDVLAQA